MTTLPIGKKDKFKYESVNKGDLLKLVTGETVTFEEMKRTRFAARMPNKGGVSVPCFRDRGCTIPYVTEIIGHNPKAAPKVVNASSLEPGALFYLEGKKGTYMFLKEDTKNIHGLELSTQKSYRIRKGDFNLIRVHLKEVYEKYIG